MGKLNDLAKKASGVSEITVGRTKISTADVIKNYPNGITITAADMFGTGDGKYAVFNIAEDNKVYFFGGKALTEMLTEWLTSCDTIDEVNAQLAVEPVKIKLTQTKTKKNQDFTSFEVIA